MGECEEETDPVSSSVPVEVALRSPPLASIDSLAYPLAISARLVEMERCEPCFRRFFLEADDVEEWPRMPSSVSVSLMEGRMRA